jgi:hypothetical protein
MVEYYVELHRLAGALNLKLHRVACKGARGDQIGKLHFAVQRIDVVAVLIDLVVADRDHEVAYLHPSFHRGHAGLEAGDIDAAGLPGLPGKLSQLRIARREETESGRREPTVIVRFRGFQKVSDDRRGNRVETASGDRNAGASRPACYF